MIDGYTLIEHSGNETGKFEVDPLTIIYYYGYNTKATVQHIDRETGEILEQSTEEGLVGDLFETESKNFEGYVLVEEPVEKTVEMTKDEIVLKYYYSKATGVIEKHIDEHTGEILANAVHSGVIGTEYNIPAREFEGYDLVTTRLPDNAIGTMTEDTIEVVYYYNYKTKVTAEYIDLSTGEKLVPDETQDGHVGDDYTTERKNFDGYVLVEVPDNADGDMTRDEITVTYYYKKIAGGVVINHLDVVTGKQLVDEEKLEGYVGEDYETEPKNIPEYRLVQERYPENAEGQFEDGIIYVTYYYESPATVTVNYYDIDTKEDLADSEEIKGLRGEEYTTQEKKFQYYELVEVEGKREGIMEGDTTVDYKYRKMKFNLKIDKTIAKININGREIEVNSELGKAEIQRAQIQKAQIKVEYTIKVTNDSQIAGSATIQENSPDTMTMAKADNPDWKIGTTQATLETEQIQSGQSKE